ncbi:hypothetical protein GCM10022289_15080 [Pedobacter jeongneungensis]|uniref:Uncharacterized protein n=1 Tax=Pedobacter jeongneungensis TaxID=947309 RepID=A0ABP8BAE2_9SPHI
MWDEQQIYITVKDYDSQLCACPEILHEIRFVVVVSAFLYDFLNKFYTKLFMR